MFAVLVTQKVDLKEVTRMIRGMKSMFSRKKLEEHSLLSIMKAVITLNIKKNTSERRYLEIKE